MHAATHLGSHRAAFGTHPFLLGHATEPEPAVHVYDWPALQRTCYRWWTKRLRRTFALFDVTRIDHFRGFVAYWAVPSSAKDARGGRWVRGPGQAVFDAAARELGELPVIAEDLGVVTPP